MDYQRRSVDSIRGRRDFRWDQRFCVRRPEAYPAEDQHVLIDEGSMRNIVPTDTKGLVDEFLGSLQSDLDPPCFIFDTVRGFLENADVRLLTTHRDRPTELNELALVDDRRDLTGGTGYLNDLEMYERRRNAGSAALGRDELVALEQRVHVAAGIEFRRNWDSKLYLEHPPKGDDELIYQKSLNERDLYIRLNGKVRSKTSLGTELSSNFLRDCNLEPRDDLCEPGCNG